MECKKELTVVGAVVVLVLAGALDSGSCESGGGEGKVYGEAFAWEIKGATVEEVWNITGNFVEVAQWIRTLLKASYLVAGTPQQPGCVRKEIIYPLAPGQLFTYSFDELLTIDAHAHYYSYTILNITTPGFSLLRGFKGFIKVSPLPGPPATTLFQWSYVTGAASNMSAADVHDLVYGQLFAVALMDLQTDLSLPDGSVTLISPTH